jgi:hypothetical protein
MGTGSGAAEVDKSTGTGGAASEARAMDSGDEEALVVGAVLRATRAGALVWAGSDVWRLESIW